MVTTYGSPSGAAEKPPPPSTRLGIVCHSYSVDRSVSSSGAGPGRFSDPLVFLDHCLALGAGGIQVGIGIRAPEYTAALRKKAEEHGAFVEGQTRLPRDKADAERFEAELRTARDSGAPVLRIAAGERRYEQHADLRSFEDFAARTWASLCIAAPVAARCGVRLAIENHKDFRVDELLDMLRRLSSEHVGVCVDTNNSIALLEDPMAVVEALAPWAQAVHLKDLVLGPCQEGFLLGEAPLGEGILDIQAVVRVLRRARPGLRFAIEMITRDPLKIPCLSDAYWMTLPRVDARDLARTMRLVRSSAEKRPVPRVGHLPHAEKLALEDENIRRCFAYGRTQLEL